VKDKGEESSERQRGKRGSRDERAMELSEGAGRNWGGEMKTSRDLLCEKDTCRILLHHHANRFLLLLLKSLNEDEREPKSL